MESFTLTRNDMACLLLALDGKYNQKPLQVLQTAWIRTHQYDMAKGTGLPAFLSTMLPPIIEKLIKGNELKGFSLQEIAALGHLIEHSNLSITSMQNWVKRDFKPYFNCSRAGKKYSLNQAALLFIIDDLKSNLDFESIRKLFDLIFKKPDNKSVDLVGPIELYATYTSMFEELDANNDQLFDISSPLKESPHQNSVTENVIRAAANQFASRLPNLSGNQQEAVRNILLLAVISIQTSYFHSLSRRYCNATLFLNLE